VSGVVRQNVLFTRRRTHFGITAGLNCKEDLLTFQVIQVILLVHNVQVQLIGSEGSAPVEDSSQILEDST
jgi:hypothetical protein